MITETVLSGRELKTLESITEVIIWERFAAYCACKADLGALMKLEAKGLIHARNRRTRKGCYSCQRMGTDSYRVTFTKRGRRVAIDYFGLPDH